MMQNYLSQYNDLSEVININNVTQRLESNRVGSAYRVFKRSTTLINDSDETLEAQLGEQLTDQIADNEDPDLVGDDASVRTQITNLNKNEHLQAPLQEPLKAGKKFLTQVASNPFIESTIQKFKIFYGYFQIVSQFNISFDIPCRTNLRIVFLV